MTKLLNAQQVADLLVVKLPTVYKWAQMGKIPFYQLEGCKRFGLEDIERYIEERRIQNG